ncbi:TPA: flagellin, partial [Campylobacter jejuni]|nr:flagellin [Campylobacter jejuni]HEB8392960.1 flagellin [Campylobacter jejuni]
VKDTTGVQASKDENGKLVLTSADGRGIKITGSIGAGAGILQKENYGRLSLVKNDGRDINVSGTNLSAIGMGTTDMISQASVSLRESKGQISAANADAMGFNSYNGGGAKQLVYASSISVFMSQEGSGFSKGSGFSAGSGKDYSKVLSGSVQIVSGVASISNTYVVSKGSGFSTGSGNSQFAALKITTVGATDETAGVTTLKGAMAVMDIAETAITNLD